MSSGMLDLDRRVEVIGSARRVVVEQTQVCGDDPGHTVTHVSFLCVWLLLFVATCTSTMCFANVSSLHTL